MKKALYIILCIATVCACEKQFDIEKQMKDGMTYIKFVPSNDDDTTFFFVQATTALKDGKVPAKTSGEKVTVTVNGTELELTKDLQKSHDDGCQIYWTKHTFQENDAVVAEASVLGRKTVSAATTIPGQMPEFKWTKRVDVDSESNKSFFLTIDYDNMPGCSGYYGVALKYEQTREIRDFCVYRDKPDVIEWFEPETTIVPGCEDPLSVFDIPLTSLGMTPLVLKPGLLNRDPEWDMFFGNDDFGFGHTYNATKVLSWVDKPDKNVHASEQQFRFAYSGYSNDFVSKIPDDFWERGSSEDVYFGYSYHSEYRYKFVFYNYDENCFNYLKAQENKDNGMALLGLAPASFTFTNVKDGVGICGSYTVSETDWFTIKDD